MPRTRRTKIAVIESSGNVFADLSLAEPEEELAKAQLASLIRRAIEQRRLRKVAASALMGIDRSKLSALINGRIDDFSSEGLMRLLMILRQYRSHRPAG